MKKMMICMVLALCMVFAMAGCSTNVGFIFTVDTGDEINIVLDTTDDYSFTPESPFVISCDDKVLSQGVFISSADYQEYVDVVTKSADATILETSEKNGYEYIMWTFSDGESSEWNYAMLLTENTGVLIGNNVSEETAKECFDRLTFSVED